MSQQLPLNIHLNDADTFANFFAGDNAGVVNILRDFCHSYTEPFIYLWGQAGVGCSHLLQACAHEASMQNRQTIYVPLKLAVLSPEILQNLENVSLVCLDDMDCVFENVHWEEMLFHFFNRIREQEHQLLVAAKSLPICHLADLQSRLSGGLTLMVKGLDDQQKAKALCLRAENRGLVMTGDVVQFLLHQFSRDMRRLCALLDQLDQASLAAKRRLTIPFVRDVIAKQKIGLH